MTARVKFGIPKGKTIQKRLIDGLVGGGVGGASVALFTGFLGPVLGPIIGGSLAGSIMPENTGTIVAVNATMDAVENLLLGGV